MTSEVVISPGPKPYSHQRLRSWSTGSVMVGTISPWLTRLVVERTWGQEPLRKINVSKITEPML